MRNPFISLLKIVRKLLASDRKKTGKSRQRLLIEKKWWMGDDLFIDKPFINTALEDKRLTS
ncbi:hypothetical protein ACLOAU_00905 [Niabella sp. CJ426]|uniref:hypothetical protein n=1 Tax=Niabella sp. CJ426 TaxID=3393740 RepID=UPI003CFC805F